MLQLQLVFVTSAPIARGTDDARIAASSTYYLNISPNNPVTTDD